MDTRLFPVTTDIQSLSATNNSLVLRGGVHSLGLCKDAHPNDLSLSATIHSLALAEDGHSFALREHTRSLSATVYTRSLSATALSRRPLKPLPRQTLFAICYKHIARYLRRKHV